MGLAHHLVDMLQMVVTENANKRSIGNRPEKRHEARPEKRHEAREEGPPNERLGVHPDDDLNP
jgi:hypothetical protein